MARLRITGRSAAAGLAFGAGVAGLLAAGSCRSDGPDQKAVTQVDRLVAHYPALRDGRFAVIADFESPAHASLFHVESASGQGACTMDGRAGFRPTGGTGLRVQVGSVGDALVVESGESADWFLVRDWRDYDLLLLNIRPAAQGTTLVTEISTGRGEQQRLAVSQAELAAGWNELALDLGDVAGRIPLDDIRGVRLRAAGPGGGTAGFDLDDILLTRRRTRRWGDERNREGLLYIRQRGLRLEVGAGGLFELVFSGGRVAAWYDLKSDPDRLHNLAGGTLLERRPGPQAETTVDPPLRWHSFEGEDRTAPFTVSGGGQRLSEANAVRAVVAGDAVGLRYTVYSSGHVYVYAPPESDAGGTGLWWAASLARAADWETVVSKTASETTSEGAGVSTFAAARRRSNPGCTMALLAAGHTEVREARVGDGAGSGVELMVPGDSSRTCMVRLGLGESDWPAALDEMAEAYADPPPLIMHIGWTAEDNGGAKPPRGYDRTMGCYRLRPDVQVIRFELDGRSRPIDSPAFQVIDALPGEAWAYVNHALLPAVARESDGSLVFQVPAVVRERTLVEVLIRSPEAGSGG